jgi:hypothetical protein
LLARFPDAIRQAIRALAIDEAKVATEVEAMTECTVATTNSRRVLGSMNEFVFQLEAYLDGRPLVEVALHLADTPCSPIGWQSPRAATMALFGTVALKLQYPPLHLVKR